MEMVTIYHPELKVTETVNVGLAGVLIEGSGWEKVEPRDLTDILDEIDEDQSIPRSEAMPEKPTKSEPKAKESD